MAVTTMACERCCLKYEKPVSQLYTRHPPSPLATLPPLPSHHLQLSLGLSFPPHPRPPALQKTPNYLQLMNCSLTSPGRAREGTWLRRAATSSGPRLARGARRGPGRGRARRWVGLTLICWRRAAAGGAGGGGRWWGGGGGGAARGGARHRAWLSEF